MTFRVQTQYVAPDGKAFGSLEGLDAYIREKAIDTIASFLKPGADQRPDINYDDLNRLIVEAMNSSDRTGMRSDRAHELYIELGYYEFLQRAEIDHD
jgi:hypothetical protein